MDTHSHIFDVIILGGGAAGLMCAMEAAKRGRRVVVLESNDRLGKKILISGGGRCNFTNIHATAENFLSQQPDFCKSALARYTPHHFIALVEQHGIVYHEKKLGQLFCTGSSKEIVQLLEKECRAAGVAFQLGCRTNEVQHGELFRIESNFGMFTGQSLVVATGGLSYPQIGATNLGYRIARQFELEVTKLRPALVPLLWSKSEQESFGPLSGISVDSSARCGKISFRENLLFTHRGLSGPAILQISSYWKSGDSIEINLLPNLNIFEWLKSHINSAAELSTVLSEILPRRFVQVWCEKQMPSRPMKNFTLTEIGTIAQRLHAWNVQPLGDEGYARAEVTHGGVDTRELSSRTMEARRVPGLFFIGEVVDVTGWLGGYNFQWAWASGHAAGQIV